MNDDESWVVEFGPGNSRNGNSREIGDFGASRFPGKIVRDPGNFLALKRPLFALKSVRKYGFWHFQKERIEHDISSKLI